MKMNIFILKSNIVCESEVNKPRWKQFTNAERCLNFSELAGKQIVISLCFILLKLNFLNYCSLSKIWSDHVTFSICINSRDLSRKKELKILTSLLCFSLFRFNIPSKLKCVFKNMTRSCELFRLHELRGVSPQTNWHKFNKFTTFFFIEYTY